MKFYRGLEKFNYKGNTVITLGKFDGFHRGHQKLLKKVRELSTADIKSLVLSFNISAYKIAQGYECPEIMSIQDKCKFLEGKVDYLIEYQFTDSLRQMEAIEFVEKVLVNRLGVKHIVVGQGFQFGKGGGGNIALLRTLGEEYGFEVHVVDKLSYGFETISSTYVRMEINQGRMEIVSDLLDYNYAIEGIVEHGAKIGRTIGFPTLNVRIPDNKMVPPRGVYICKVFIDEKMYYAMSNLGTKPTVSDGEIDLLEVHVLDYDDNAYGKFVKVEFLHRLRMEKKFENLAMLTGQIEMDLLETKRFVNEIKDRISFR